MIYADMFSRGDLGDCLRDMGYSSFAVERGSGDASGSPTFEVVSSNPEAYSKKAISRADLVYVDGSDPDVLRAACELWTVDLVVDPELNRGRDGLYNCSSGLDPVCLKMMAERNMGYLVNFRNILDSRRMSRVRVLSRVWQNIRLCRKYGVRVVASSCAKTAFDARNPHEIANFLIHLGATRRQAFDAVSANPAHFLDKAKDRGDPSCITAGLRVLDWGSQKMKPNRKYGWL